ncbi:FecR domain-containing protein [Methylobacterium sp. NEAU 140]|uniref:FecR family protein n=1 Tax=Methylobacterium sp. NEAU 140 TaxID=3064945 RepID=UPI0027366486|nr:FecR domain-containing protein [Methylobacterium sp. NEAU 140]MDP4026644.1 FecR domain-containing protein [Methylobacterium sp. NEAU 140]
MDEHDGLGGAGDAEDDPVYERAAFWVVRLSSPDATDADRRAFETWRGADQAHSEAYAEMEAWRHAAGRVPDPRARKCKMPTGLVVLAVLLGLTGLVGHEAGLIDRLRADAWTDIGDIESMALPDGSRAVLNTDTALALRFTTEARDIDLLRGEAMFEVVPDRDRPFVVRGDGLRVRAVGTRFFVRANGSAEPVGVVEGRVDASMSAERVTIGAGEVALRGADGRLEVERGDVARATAWRDGKLVVSGKPLAEIVTELNRYRRGRIVLLGDVLGAQRFSGALDLRDTDGALDVLTATMGLRITRLTPFLVLVRAPA